MEREASMSRSVESAIEACRGECQLSFNVSQIGRELPELLQNGLRMWERSETEETAFTISK